MKTVVFISYRIITNEKNIIMRRRNDDGLTYIDGQGYEGVVYSYQNSSDDNKVYVGCTPRERTRRDSWRNWKNAYAGEKIKNARQSSAPSDWTYKIEERLYSEDLQELQTKLEEREAYYIGLYDSCNHGYNSNFGGTGNTGKHHSEETRRKISMNHRDYQSKEAREKLSESLLGHEVKESTRDKISKGNSGKVRTDEMKQAQSERLKGIEPKAASEAAKVWREQNGGNYWSGKKMSSEAKANMSAAQRKRASKIKAHYPDDSEKVFETMLDAATELGIGTGSIHNNLKHSSPDFKTKGGYWFEKLETE